jgi:O-antigen ligase
METLLKKIFEKNNLLAAVLALLPLYLVRFSLFGIPTNVFEILVVGAFFFLAVREFGSFFGNSSDMPPYVFAGISFILLGLFLSLIANKNYPTGLGIAKGWFIIPLIFSWLILQSVRKLSDVEKYFAAIFLSSSIVSLISLFYKIQGAVTYDGRLESIYNSPNFLAMYLAPGLIFGIYFFNKALQKKTSLTNLALLCLPLLTIILALFFTYSYAAWTALLVSFFLTILLTQKSRRLFFSLAALLVLLLALSLSQEANRHFADILQASPRSSLSSRLMIWQVSARLIQQNPAVGIGPGNFQSRYLASQPFFPPFLEWSVPEPHNVLLAFWLQTGLLGLVGFIIVLAGTLANLLKNLNKKGLATALPLLVFLTYTLLHGLVDTTYWKNDLSILFWVAISLSLAINKMRSQEDIL